MSRGLLFDSLAHPTLNGSWLGKAPGQSFEELEDLISSEILSGAVACGLPNVGGYSHEAFFKRAGDIESVYPVAAITKTSSCAIRQEVREIAEIGYKSFKVHPRLLGLNKGYASYLPTIYEMAAELDLVIFICTYCYTAAPELPESDPLFELCGIMNHFPEVKTVLVHGGGVRIMEYAEVVRFNKNILLDLSLTLQKYFQSSIYYDLKFLFEKFDQRICIGTDSPEWSPIETIDFCQKLFDDTCLSQIKKDNIINKNIKNFLGLKND